MFRRRLLTTALAAKPLALDANQQQLQQLNFDFLKLLATCHQHGTAAALGTQRLALPSLQAVALAECADSGLLVMASCGFSLFGFCFHQIELWQQLTRGVAANCSMQRYAAASTYELAPIAAACAGFAECALFFGWHLAQQSNHAARLMLGMREETAAAIAGLEIWQCRQIAHQQAHLLTARWRDNPYFWPDLLRYGRSGEQQYFKFARLLGTQLIAKDLEPSAIARYSTALTA